MTSCELDPVFVRGLKLLQSRSRESKDQLRQLYDELLMQRKAELTAKRLDGDDSQDSRSSGSGSTGIKRERESPEIVKKRELEKVNLDKLKQDLAELSQSDFPSKKLRLDVPTSASANSSPRPTDRDRISGDKSKPQDAATVKLEKPRERLREIEEDIFFGPSAASGASGSSRAKDRERQEREEREKAAAAAKAREKKEIPPVQVISADSDSDTEVSDDATNESAAVQGDSSIDEMQFELDLSNLSCVICKSLSVTSSNRLVECQECHSLYHQDCHRPPVTENVNDPRFVWYCYKCTKNLKKIAIKSQKKPTKPPAPTVTRESPIAKPVKTEPSTVLQPFKRLETAKPSISKDSPGTSSTSATAAGGRGLAGLASLAANLHGRTGSGSVANVTTVSSDLAKSRTEQKSSNSNLNRLDSSKSLSSAASDSKLSASVPSWGGERSQQPKSSPFGGKNDAAKPAKLMPGLPQVTTKIVAPVASSVAGVSGSSVASSSANSSGSKMSQSQMMTADKRLQIMKKKAAAKMVEKRAR